MNFLDVITAFQQANFHAPQKEAESLVSSLLDIPMTKLYLAPLDLDNAQMQKISNALVRRLNGEPLQYITGKVDFMGLQFFVGKGVLIPRPETELLAEIVIKEAEKMTADNQQLIALDMCTGSACIAISLAKKIKNLLIYAVDISMQALSYAKKNIYAHACSNVLLIAGDLFTALKKGKRFHFIVCNPPYIKTSDIPFLQREIVDYEPIVSLDGGADGMDFYKIILADVKDYLCKNGFIVFEIGYNQGEILTSIASENGFENVKIIKDYSDIDRIAVIKN